MASGYQGRNVRTYAANTKPAKIDLLSEEPRRDSLIDEQLNQSAPKLLANFSPHSLSQQHQTTQQYNQQEGSFNKQQVHNYGSRPSSCCIIDDYQKPWAGNSTRISITTTDYSISPNQHESTSSPLSSQAYINYAETPQKRVTTSANVSVARDQAFQELEQELISKEAQLKKELAYLNQYQNTWSLPRPTREPRREPAARISPAKSEQRWTKECPSGPSSRPTSRASSTRSNAEADLLEKAAKLLKDVEEIEKKPLHKRQILIESGALASSRAQSVPADQGLDVGSIHTAIIKVPRNEVDNKSPLPFSFDNFSTHGVRGNIASVGAAEPDTPYAPIFPTIKRTPSPSNRRM